MIIFKEVITELIGMFISDAWLSVAVLIVVALSAALLDLAGLHELVSGAVLLLGCLAVVFESVRRAASRQNTDGN